MDGSEPKRADKFEYDAGEWLSIHAYIEKMARRAFPRDPDAADDIAGLCLEIYMRNHAGKEMQNFEAWVGRSIAGLKKNHIRNSYRLASINDDDDPDMLERIRATPATQDTVAEANFWRRQIELLPEPERSAYRELADGGDLRDVMLALDIGPREALDCLKRGREYLWRIGE